MRTRVGIMRWVWIVALALGAACGGETATGPSEVPPVVEVPDVAGTYNGTAEAKTLVATKFEGSISGAARLRVEQQGATVTVSGELLVRGPQQNLDATGTIDGQGRFTRTDGVLAHRIEESLCGWMDYEGEPLLSFRDGTAEYGVSLITERCDRLRLGATLTRNNGRPAGPVPMSGSILDCPRKIAGGGYTVCHVDGYGDDARSVRDILDAAIPRLRQRYGPTSTPVDIYLFPEPGTVHGITIQPGTALAYGGPRHLALYLMAVSAPSMQGACCTGLGVTFTDPAYQRTVHVHEFATAFIHHYSGYRKWAGWFVQGLEQYEGLEASGSLWSRAAERVWRDNSVSCQRNANGREELIVSEPYWAGAVVLQYLADRFGKRSHIRILESNRTTITEAIADEQPTGETPCDLVDDWGAWMRNRYGLRG